MTESPLEDISLEGWDIARGAETDRTPFVFKV